jgi:DNA-binding NarL/FixJ family response regulator
MKILVVDDERIIVQGIMKRLEKMSHLNLQVAGAYSGSEALNIMSYFAPDLLIMDTSLPGLSGLAAASLIAGACPDTQILMMSDEESPGLRESSIAAGAHGFTSKAELAVLFAQLCGPVS